MRPDVDLIVRADDPHYNLQAAAEASFWNAQHPVGMETWEMTLPEGPADYYTNERFTGSRSRHWYDLVRAPAATGRGLILGTSGFKTEGEILRRNPNVSFTFADISPGGLQRRMDIFAEEFRGRIDTMVADFNFIELEPGAYDLIVSSSSIHHVTNLEHLVYQVNRALSEDGRFFLHDYVGEPRFNFSQEKRAIFEAISARDYARGGVVAKPVEWLSDEDLSPFCGVRSHDILRICAVQLRPLDVRTAGSLLVPLLRCRRADRVMPRSQRYQASLRGVLQRVTGRKNAPRRGWIDTRFLQELETIGDLLADSGVIAPGNAFGVYGRG